MYKHQILIDSILAISQNIYYSFRQSYKHINNEQHLKMEIRGDDTACKYKKGVFPVPGKLHYSVA